MTTAILNIKGRRALPYRLHPAALARLLAFAPSLDAYVRWWISIAAISVAIASATAYVASVNAMLLAGEAMRRDARVLADLEQEYATRSGELLARESPAPLEASAREAGMVDATGVRFLTAGEEPIALSR